jgi:hypothetical protein
VKKPTIAGDAWVLLHIFWFLAAFAATGFCGSLFTNTVAGYCLLAVPGILVGLPVAIFVLSRRAKLLMITALSGSLIWIVPVLIDQISKT